GLVMFFADQMRILESWRASKLSHAALKLLACCCQPASRANAASGELARGSMPARKRALSSALLSAAVLGRTAKIRRLGTRAANMAHRSCLCIVWLVVM